MTPGRAASFVGVLVLVALIVAGEAPVATAQVPPPAPTAGPTTVVSLTFDDGLADQLGYLDTLRAHGLLGTFYVNSGAVGQPHYLTRDGLAAIAAAGDEIGGHTVSHPQLVGNTPEENLRQICDDRATLTSWGYHPVSFAYPFGSYDPSVEAAARDCGYTSARRVGGLGPVTPACPTCQPAESVPPADPFAVRSPGEVSVGSTLAELEQSVIDAQNAGGGWVPFIFHHESCDTCGDLSTTPALLDRFATWLGRQQAQGRLAVRTVGQVTGTPGGPVHLGPPATTPAVANPTFADGDATLPDCWAPAGFGVNTATYRRDGLGAGQPQAETITMTAHTSGDATMVPRLDLGQCTAWTRPGLAVGLGAVYRSTVPTQFAVYRRTGTGSWVYWTSSPWVGPSDGWRVTGWTTPPTPPDTSGVAAGLVINQVGSLSSTDYRVGPLPPPPLIPPGTRGVLVVGAAVAALLGLLGALVGLVHHHLRRRRYRAAARASVPRQRVSEPGTTQPDPVPAPVTVALVSTDARTWHLAASGEQPAEPAPEVPEPRRPVLVALHERPRVTDGAR